MTDYRFVTVDVFTDRRFGGNPLAVFPEAEGLSDADILSLTREFNYSESTFVLPPQDPANDARVRIFCPGGEMPFAGHPMVGTGHVLAKQRGKSELRFEVPAGIVKVAIRPQGAFIDAPKPLQILGNLPAADVAACVGLEPADVIGDAVEASVGIDFIFAELKPDALSRARPDLGAFRRAADKHGKDERFDILFYVRESGNKIRARMFAPLQGIVEDPATGSANAVLAALLLEGDCADFTVSQGVEMGRPSLLHLTAKRGADGVRSTVGGGCVPMFEGRVTL